jgi:hypothetical protein
MMGGITDAILLVALGLGYIVCYLANREEKTLRSAGYLIGVFIIFVSAMFIINNIIFSVRLSKRFGMPCQSMMMKGQLPPPPTEAPQK